MCVCVYNTPVSRAGQYEQIINTVKNVINHSFTICPDVHFYTETLFYITVYFYSNYKVQVFWRQSSFQVYQLKPSTSTVEL